MLLDKNALHVVMGLGKTGFSVVEYLHQQGIPVAVTDSRHVPPFADSLRRAHPHIQQYTGGFHANVLSRADVIIISPGVCLKEPLLVEAAKQGKIICGDVDFFAKAAETPICAITGTNGKTTVTTLMGEVANHCGVRTLVGGNIGTPMLELLTTPKPQLYVLELSSFQLETSHYLAPQVATILNVTPDHMDRYNSFDDYVLAKQRIYQHAEQCVYNRQDKATYPKALEQAVSFGLDEPQSDQQFGLRKCGEVSYLAFGEENLLKASDLKLKGQQNWANALAVLALGHSLGFPMEGMLAAVKHFSGLPHRCQWVRTINQVAWVNDSKSTNVGACVAALDGLSAAGERRIILLAGGQAKDADFSSLVPVAAAHVKQAILFGEDADLLAKALSKAVEITRVEDLSEAVQCAAALAQAGDIVLLSPACASFDMFANFEHRGDTFITLVQQL